MRVVFIKKGCFEALDLQYENYDFRYKGNNIFITSSNNISEFSDYLVIVKDGRNVFENIRYCCMNNKDMVLIECEEW